MAPSPADPDAPSCAAIIWTSGRRCRREATPGSHYCSQHAALAINEQWSAAGYAEKIQPDERPLFESARFSELSDEIAVARLQVRSLLAQKGSPQDLIATLRTLARLIKLRHDLDA